MGIQNLLTRYALAARARGESEETIRHISRIVGFFDHFMGGIDDVTQIQDDDLRRFIVALRQKEKWAGLPQAKGQKLSGTTVNTYTRAVKAFFSWLKREGILATDPFTNVPAPKLPQRLPKVLSENEMTAVFKVVAESPRERALLLLLLDSGITLSEVAELNDSHVDIVNGTVRVFREKTQKERYTYISPPTADAIEAYRFVRPKPLAEPRLFLTRDGYPLTGKRIQKILERIGKKAGIGQRLSPHKLRHSFATWSLRYGSNLEYIRLMLGHSDISTTSRAYLHVSNADLAAASKRTSPVVNLGIGRSKGRPGKPTPEPDTARRQGKTTIVVKLQPQGPDPAAGVQPVAYDKKQMGRKKGNR